MADYHQYVISDGKLVAEFEAMYQRSRDIPWHQNEQDNWIDVRLTTEILKDIGPFDEIHDFGCGLGYYLDILKSRIGSVGCRTFGYDVSYTACKKAGCLFPAAEFAVIDLMANPLPASQPVSQSASHRLFAIRGTLWYVFPEFANVVTNLRSKMRRGELLLVVQNFPPFETDFVGKDVMPDPQALIRWFSADFDSIRTLWYEDRMKSANDNWFIGFFVAR